MRFLRQTLHERSKASLYMLAQLFDVRGRSKMNTDELEDAVYYAMKNRRKPPRLSFGECSDEEKCSDVELGRGATSTVVDCERGAKKIFHTRKFYDLEKKEFQDLALVDPAFEYFVKPICFNDAGKFIIMEKMSVNLKEAIEEGGLPADSFHKAIARTAEGIRLLHRYHGENSVKSYTDLKESNIMFNLAGESKIADVGSIRTFKKDAAVVTNVIYTKGYCNPYRLPDQPPGSNWEVFSLGVIIFKYFTDDFPSPREGCGDGREWGKVSEYVSGGREILEQTNRVKAERRLVDKVMTSVKLPHEINALVVGMLTNRISIEDFIGRWRAYNPRADARSQRANRADESKTSKTQPLSTDKSSRTQRLTVARKNANELFRAGLFDMDEMLR